MNTWITLTDTLSTWVGHGKKFNSRTRPYRRRIAVFLAVIGPGLITSNVDNDAGGITTYTVAGAQFGYTLLWSLIPMTIALYVSEEMCARMGVVTGKGLSDLIREEFGFRSTFFVMLAALAVDLGNTVAEFAGVAAAMQIFGISKYISVPLAGLAVWFLVVRGSARQVEKIFLVACGFYITYVFSAILAKPDWLLSGEEKPWSLRCTSIIRVFADAHRAWWAPPSRPGNSFTCRRDWSRKRVGARQYKHAKLDVLVGSISCMVIVFFIIVCCAATLNAHGLTNITDAGAGRAGVAPWSPGRWAADLFAFGLLNASLFAASILPLSTAHVICEGLGFEAGLDHKVKEAPGLLFSLHWADRCRRRDHSFSPTCRCWKILVFSQVANGVWLPVVLIFILLLINRRDLMGDHTNTLTFNIVAWATGIIMIVLTVVLVYAALFQPAAAGLG